MFVSVMFFPDALYKFQKSNGSEMGDDGECE